MRPFLTTEEFILRARREHGDKYDYSLVEYCRSSQKVKIICRKHGVFEQLANSHLQGDGCPVCWKEKLNGYNWARGRKPIKGQNEKRCPMCKKKYPRTNEFFHKNSCISDGLSIYCKSCALEINKKSKIKYRDKIIMNSKRYNKDRIKSGYFRAYYKERRKNDVDFNVLNALRNRLWQALTTCKGIKSASVLKLTGCSLLELKKHLESQFDEGMTWDNYGYYGWHIDHIIPCASFNLTREEEQKKCFHYTNLQPLWSKDNIRKGAKI